MYGGVCGCVHPYLPVHVYTPVIHPKARGDTPRTCVGIFARQHSVSICNVVGAPPRRAPRRSDVPPPLPMGGAVGPDRGAGAARAGG